MKLHFHHHSDSSLFWECSPPLILDESFSRKSMKLFTLHLTWGITLLYSSFSWTEKWISISIRNTKRDISFILKCHILEGKTLHSSKWFQFDFPQKIVHCHIIILCEHIAALIRTQWPVSHGLGQNFEGWAGSRCPAVFSTGYCAHQGKNRGFWVPMHVFY